MSTMQLAVLAELLRERHYGDWLSRKEIESITGYKKNYALEIGTPNDTVWSDPTLKTGSLTNRGLVETQRFGRVVKHKATTKAKIQLKTW